MVKIYEALEKFKTESAADTPEKSGGIRKEKRAARKSFKTPLRSGEPLSKSALLERNLVVVNDPQSHAAEQFKILRTRLLFPHHGSPPRVIMITSSTQGEGKSFTAANLAAAIAQGINEHVLLIDCDMRRPVQNQIFGFGRVDGLSDYLTGRRKFEEVMLKTSVEKLTLVPGGHTPPNPSELLSSKRMSELLVEVKERYQDRYIIIDTPPPHLTAEANALASQMDCILLVIQHMKTPKEQVETLVEKLGREKIMGVILNQFDKVIKKYGYYNYYY